jgi:hypothetical protein
VQIGSSGSLPRKVCSRSNPFSALWLALKVDVSLRKVCGELKLLRGRLFLRGLHPWVRSLLWTISGRSILSLWTDVARAIKMGNL